MRRHHQPPLGAEYLGDGQTCLTLWATAAERAWVDLENGDGTLMQRGEEGVFSATVPAEPGARYRYRVEDEIGVPDPASRYQPVDVHGPSQVVDPTAFV